MDLLLQVLIQKLLEKRRVFHRLRQQNHLRRRAAGKIILLDERAHCVFFLVRRLQNLIVLVKQISIHIVQHRKARLRLALIIADDVGICHRTCGHKLLLSERLHCAQPISQQRRLFKIERLCAGKHLFADGVSKLGVFPLQKHHCLLHARAVLRGERDAGTRRRSCSCDN